MNNTRYIAFAMAVAALGAAATSNAQVRFFFAYGDAGLAQLQTRSWFGNAATQSNAAVGVEITTPKLMIPKSTDTNPGLGAGEFVLQIWGEVVGTTTATSQGPNVFVAFDKATGNGGATWAAATGPVRALGYQNPGTVDGTVLTPASTQPAPILKYANVRADGTTTSGSALRPAGLDQPYRVPVGSPVLNLAPGAKFRIADVLMKNNGLAIADIWGDADEYGVGLPVTPTQTSTSARNGFGQSNNTGQILDVQAVPEPGTMIALGAGLAAVAARRRRKN